MSNHPEHQTEHALSISTPSTVFQTPEIVPPSPACIHCGTKLGPMDTHCSFCGEETLAYKTQHICVNCGSPAAQAAQICIMCGHEIDELPQLTSRFSVSWSGVIIGLALVLSMVYWFFQLQPLSTGYANPVTATPTPPEPKLVLLTGTPSLISLIVSPPPTPTASDTPTATATQIIYQVRRGDNLSVIADTFDTTIDDLLALNKALNDNSILSVGQEVILPPPDLGSTTYEHPVYGPIVNYLIKRGDTLSTIAEQYDTTMAAIRIGNPQLNLDILAVGQEIVIPLRLPTFTRTPTITVTPTFTPGPPYPAPALLRPAHEALIQDENSILLNWTSSGLLEDPFFYVVILYNETTDETTHYWTKTTSHRLSDQDRSATLARYTWRVVVAQQTGGDQYTFYGKPASIFSEIRTFTW